MINQTIHALPMNGEIFSAKKPSVLEIVRTNEVPGISKVAEEKPYVPQDVLLRMKQLQTVILDAAKLQSVRESLKALEEEQASTFQ